MIIHVDSIEAKIHGLISRGVKAVEVNASGHLIFTLTDDSTVDLGVVVGDDGVTYTPSVDSSGNISWTNDGGRENPTTRNIKGPTGQTGKSAYQAAVDGGYTGTEAEFNAEVAAMTTKAAAAASSAAAAATSAINASTSASNAASSAGSASSDATAAMNSYLLAYEKAAAAANSATAAGTSANTASTKAGEASSSATAASISASEAASSADDSSSYASAAASSASDAASSAAEAAEIAASIKGIYKVEYGVTTYENIMTAVAANYLPVCVYTPSSTTADVNTIIMPMVGYFTPPTGSIGSSPWVKFETSLVQTRGEIHSCVAKLSSRGFPPSFTWSYEESETDIGDKVDKVTGKGLSEEDYTTEEKTKLAGIATGATANTGTVTSISVKMNGSTKGTVTTSGTINLGTVITSHQDISGKADKVTGSTAGHLASLDSNGNLVDSGKSFSDISQTIGTINISTSWTGSASPYTQTVTVTGATVTANSKVDIQPSYTTLAQMLSDGCNALYIENNNGTLTLYAVGAGLTVAQSNVQVTVTEVTP